MYNKTLVPVICYITKKPVVYNEGTKYEKTCNHFLWSYSYRTPEEVKAYIDELNTNKPAFDRSKRFIDWENIDHFFYSEQEDMC